MRGRAAGGKSAKVISRARHFSCRQNNKTTRAFSALLLEMKDLKLSQTMAIAIEKTANECNVIECELKKSIFDRRRRTQQAMRASHFLTHQIVGDRAAPILVSFFDP